MTVRFTTRELDVMSVLWERGPSTVAEVREALEDQLAYNTVLTVLRILEDKGHVAHEEEGRAHRYLPLVERVEAGESALKRIKRRLFSDSPELVLTHLVNGADVTEDEIRRMQDLLTRRLDMMEDER